MTSGDHSPAVSVIIPTLHLVRPRNPDPKNFLFPRYTLKQVLDDLQNNVALAIEVVIVCNGADPALIDLVKTHPRVDKYCLNSVNVGVSRAWNMGAMMAEGDALCFLNDDVAVGAGVIEALYRVLKSDETIGEVGPKGNTMKGADHDRFIGQTEPEDGDMISGFCFMVRSSTFHEIGGVDIAYTPAGYEDSDFSFRIRQQGLRCHVVPGLDIKHYLRHGVSAKRTNIEYLGKSIKTDALHERNKAYFMRKWSIPT
jgi:GT2 family glycosyltransferase